MGKQIWKPGTMIYPLPAVMVTCGNMENSNIITVAWTGTICTNPAMTYISIRPERYSYHMIKTNGEFVINLTTRDLVYATDWAGVKSGKDCNKFEVLGLTKEKASILKVPLIKESPVNIECKVREIKELGSHHMFLAEVVAVNADEKYFDENNKFCLEKANLITYSHGKYFELGKELGKFGFSVKKK
ncbi:MAG: flavin reductase family protein [Clostridia bacterium]|nr:flavin reductase family protein [Clostridia bacterium]